MSYDLDAFVSDCRAILKRDPGPKGREDVRLHLEKLLADRGDSVAGLIRNPAQADDLAEVGADALVLDLENASVDQVAQHLTGADAVVFAAGAGPGSGVSRKATVDRDAAILLRAVTVEQIRAAANAGVRMPQKTTFFAPKPRTGMVFRSLDL